jgi:hypothetical protein
VSDKESEFQTLERRDYRVEAILANARVKAKRQLKLQNEIVLRKPENSSTCSDDEPDEETSGVMRSTGSAMSLESEVHSSTGLISSVMLLTQVFFRPVVYFLLQGRRLLKSICHLVFNWFI